jgi:hypothetical protein
MNERENRDDIVKRVIDHKQANERRHLTAKERQAVVEYVKKDILPPVYQK